MTRWLLPAVALGGAIVGAGGVYAVGKAAGGAMVRDYLLENPEVIREAATRLEARDQAKAVATAGGGVTKPYAGAWIGNPKADVTLVEFYDYNCGYCRSSVPVLAQLIARDPSLRIVFRELPILAASSRDGARASLAAARANRFKPFHDALYAGGPVSAATIAAAARTAGVSVPARDPAADAEIASNLRAAEALGVTGTPSWLVGDRVLIGAQPLAELEAAIAAARASG